MSHKTELKELITTILKELQRLNAQMYAQNVDIIQIHNLFRAINLRLDVFASNTPAVRSGGTTGPRRIAITTFWKNYYCEIMTELKDGEVADSDLNILGITKEIIDYVRLHKPNNKKTTKQRLETEGGHIWRELGVRVRKEKENTESTKNTWTRVKENIEDFRNTRKINLEKKEFISLQPEVLAVPIPPPSEIDDTKVNEADYVNKNTDNTDNVADAADF